MTDTEDKQLADTTSNENDNPVSVDSQNVGDDDLYSNYPKTDNPKEVYDWLIQNNEGEHYDYVGCNITPEMLAKAAPNCMRLKIPVESWGPATILFASDSTDEEIDKLIYEKEHPEPDFEEIIANTPGVLTEADIREIHIKASHYIMNQRKGNSIFMPRALMDNVGELPVGIGERFDAHGMAKGDELNHLNYLLSNGIYPKRKFHTCPLRMGDMGAGVALGASGVYDTGAFIVLSGVDKQIREDGIKYVLVNEHYYEGIPLLQEKFPNIGFIKASDMKESLAQIVKDADMLDAAGNL